MKRSGGSGGASAVTGLPASLGASGRAGAGSSHKPKRASAASHRMVAKPDAWAQKYRELECHFGPDLCGLSGLVLAAEADAHSK